MAMHMAAAKAERLELAGIVMSLFLMLCAQPDVAQSLRSTLFSPVSCIECVVTIHETNLRLSYVLLSTRMSL